MKRIIILSLAAVTVLSGIPVLAEPALGRVHDDVSSADSPALPDVRPVLSQSSFLMHERNFAKAERING